MSTVNTIRVTPIGDATKLAEMSERARASIVVSGDFERITRLAGASMESPAAARFSTLVAKVIGDAKVTNSFARMAAQSSLSRSFAKMFAAGATARFGDMVPAHFGGPIANHTVGFNEARAAQLAKLVASTLGPAIDVSAVLAPHQARMAEIARQLQMRSEIIADLDTARARLPRPLVGALPEVAPASAVVLSASERAVEPTDASTAPGSLSRAWPHVALVSGTWSAAFLFFTEEIRHLWPDRTERDVQLFALALSLAVTLAAWQLFDRWYEARENDRS